MQKHGWETLMIIKVYNKKGWKPSQKQIKTLPTDKTLCYLGKTHAIAPNALSRKFSSFWKMINSTWEILDRNHSSCLSHLRTIKFWTRQHHLIDPNLQMSPMTVVHDHLIEHDIKGSSATSHATVTENRISLIHCNKISNLFPRNC